MRAHRTCPVCGDIAVGDYCEGCGRSSSLRLDEAEYLYDEQEYITAVLEGRC